MYLSFSFTFRREKCKSFSTFYSTKNILNTIVTCSRNTAAYFDAQFKREALLKIVLVQVQLLTAATSSQEEQAKMVAESFILLAPRRWCWAPLAAAVQLFWSVSLRWSPKTMQERVVSHWGGVLPCGMVMVGVPFAGKEVYWVPHSREAVPEGEARKGISLELALGLSSDVQSCRIHG